MERLWRVHRYRSKAGDINQQDPPVLYLHINPYNGFAGYNLYGACILEKYEKIYLGGEEKSLVLFVENHFAAGPIVLKIS